MDFFYSTKTYVVDTQKNGFQVLFNDPGNPDNYSQQALRRYGILSRKHFHVVQQINNAPPVQQKTNFIITSFIFREKV